jgi:hypothetical protein
MTGRTNIHVALLGEGVDVWKPVEAEHISSDIYLVVDQHYDREIERWQFEPGDRVLCRIIESGDGPILAAMEKVDPDQ